MVSYIFKPDRVDITLVQALADLAQVRLLMTLLEEEYQQQGQRLVQHVKRAGLLTTALATERAKRLTLQAQVADLERQRRYLQIALQTTHEPPKEWAVGQ